MRFTNVQEYDKAYLLLEGSESTILALALTWPSKTFSTLVLCSLRNLLRSRSWFWVWTWASSLGHPITLGFGTPFPLEQVDDDMDRRWADGTRFLGGDSGLASGESVGLWKVRREGIGIPCGRGEEGSFWNRDLRLTGWRGDTVWALGSGLGCWAGEGLELGLRMWENHLWTADAGDDSAGDTGEVGPSNNNTSDLFPVCLLADLDRISPLKLSVARYLYDG